MPGTTITLSIPAALTVVITVKSGAALRTIEASKPATEMSCIQVEVGWPMSKAATGSIFHSRGAWFARVTLDGGKRKAFRLVEATESAARSRLAVLSSIAVKLRASGHGERAEALVAEAATAPPEDLAAVVQSADSLCLCRTDVPPLKPKAPASPSHTIAALAKRWTSGDLAREYPDHLSALKKAAAVWGLVEKHVLPQIGGVPVQEATIEHLEQVMRAYHGEASSRRRVGMLVSRILALAVYPLKLIKASPIPRGFFRAPKADKAKVYLYPDEDAKLLACTAVPLRLRVFYGFLDREGMRASEAEALTMRDIDLDRGAVTLDENKTDDPRAWALSPGVVRAMRAWMAMRQEHDAGPGDSVFIFDDGEMSHRAVKLRGHLRRAGVDRGALFERTPSRRPIRVHDLRATFVTIALANGKTEAWISDRTGHKSSEMINRYRRAARTVAELGLGDLVPLDEAIPELRMGGGIASAQKPAATAVTRSSSCNPRPAPISTKASAKPVEGGRKSGPLMALAADAAVSSGAPGMVQPTMLPFVNDVGALAMAASWRMGAVAANDRAAA